MNLKDLLQYWPLLTAFFSFLSVLIGGIFLIVRYFYLKLEKRVEALEKELFDQKLAYQFMKEKEPLLKKFVIMVEQMETFGIVQWIKNHYDK